MLKKLYKVFKSIRHSYCPKRIYAYGTNGLRYFDDRTTKEKVFDFIDTWFDNHIVRESAPRWRVTEWTDSLGNSSQKIKESEKSGYAYMSPREWDQHTAKAKKTREKEEKDRFREKVKFAVSEIKKGRKYTREWGRPLKALRDK